MGLPGRGDQVSRALPAPSRPGRSNRRRGPGAPACRRRVAAGDEQGRPHRSGRGGRHRLQPRAVRPWLARDGGLHRHAAALGHVSEPRAVPRPGRPGGRDGELGRGDRRGPGRRRGQGRDDLGANGAERPPAGPRRVPVPGRGAHDSSLARARGRQAGRDRAATHGRRPHPLRHARPRRRPVHAGEERFDPHPGRRADPLAQEGPGPGRPCRGRIRRPKGAPGRGEERGAGRGHRVDRLPPRVGPAGGQARADRPQRPPGRSRRPDASRCARPLLHRVLQPDQRELREVGIDARRIARAVPSRRAPAATSR